MTSKAADMKSFLMGGTVRASIPILLLVGLVILIGSLQPSFMTADTLLVVMADTATLFILAAGITFVVMLGGIDLSIQAVASLSSVIVAITLPHVGYWAFPATLLIGFITGAFSGVVHVWLRIPSFIVTLATSGLVAAAALLLSQERSITIGETGRAYLSWITGRPFGIPSVILIGAFVACVGIWLQR
jgi:ribose transport system permease protein